jgi:hypothetical protein
MYKEVIAQSKAQRQCGQKFLMIAGNWSAREAASRS